MLAKTVLATLLLSAAGVQAHTNFRGFFVDGQAVPTQDWAYCVRPVQDNNPITDYMSNQMICNTVTGPAAGVCTAKAGQKVTMVWHEHSMSETFAVGGAHYGPIQAYMAQIPDATQSNVSGLKWFKVYSHGLLVANPQYWATDEANDNHGLVPFNLPCDLPSGDYLLRSELTALHVAGSLNGAQVYTGCAQLRITGTNTGSFNPPTVSMPGYSASDPGLLINIHTTLTGYTPPGGSSIYAPTCDGNNNQQTTTTTATTTTTTTTTKTTKTTTTSSPACDSQKVTVYSTSTEWGYTTEWETSTKYKTKTKTVTKTKTKTVSAN